MIDTHSPWLIALLIPLLLAGCKGAEQKPAKAKEVSTASSPATKQAASDSITKPIQVVVLTESAGRSPVEIEQQISCPLSLKLQGLTGIKTVRASSEFGLSTITVVFQNGVNHHEARQRVAERLTQNADLLPAGVTPSLAPSSAGSVFWYKLDGGVPDSGNLAVLNRHRIIPLINTVPGVAEVVPVDDGLPEYQILVDQARLRAYGITLDELCSAVAGSDSSVGGRVVRKNNTEQLIRVGSTEEIGNTVIKETQGRPIYVKDLATVRMATQSRSTPTPRATKTVGGVVMALSGESPAAVTRRVQERIQELRADLPEGMRILSVQEPSECRAMHPKLIPSDVEVRVFGDDLAEIKRLCEHVLAVLKPLNRARDLTGDSSELSAHLECTINRERAARLGLAVAEIQEAIEVALHGRVVAHVMERERRIPVRVRLAGHEQESVTSLQRLLLGGKSAGAAQVPLETVVDVRLVEGPPILRSENGRRFNSVTANVGGREVADFIAEAKQAVSTKVQIPAGMSIEWVLSARGSDKATK